MKDTFKPGSSYRAFFVAVAMMALGYGIYKGIMDNYLAEVINMGEMDRGITEFFRELPGLMLVFILALFYRFSAEKLFRLGAVIMLAGMAMQAIIPPSKILVIMAICIYSLGEHIQLGMRSTISLEYAQTDKGGQALGYQNSINQIGQLAGYIVVFVVFIFVSGTGMYKPFFIIAAILTGIAMLLSFRVRGDSSADESAHHFYFRKKFYKYYMLEVFYGARKQVFFTFGPYVLILFYGAKTSLISLLFAVTAICGFLLSPVVGKIIDRFGYKIVMISDTLILVIVCFFYGFAHHIFPKDVAFVVCCINYVLDSIISLASMASSVYVQDIAESREEMKATISTGLSVNHMVTIFIALFGGWIWHALGIETLFILSAVLGLCNSAYAATIKTGKTGGKITG